MGGGRRGLNRRQFMTGTGRVAAALSLASGPFVMRSGPARAAERVAFVSFGGSYGEFTKEFWIKPFTVQTGIEVDYVTGPDLARVKAQVTTQNVEWDVFDGPGSTISAGSKEGLWEPIDTRIVDLTKLVVQGGPDMVPTFIYSGGIAWDPARTKAPAKDFGQLWDVATFPGRRAFRTRISETLEMALLADGVEPGKLYPLDLDRGFKALDRVKGDVKKWFEQTTQGITIIQTNEADYTYTYANRVKSAREAGISIDFSFDQVISARNYYAVPKGSRRKEAAMRFLEFVTRPEQQAIMAEKMGFMPVTKGAAEKVSPDARKWIADPNNPRNAFVDDNYWRDNFITADKRFKEWILT
jgi:putative spermidine/putrescine transport system substrate-binding protein